MIPVVRVQKAEFDPGVEGTLLESAGIGTVATFTGLVRDDGGLAVLELEHYPAMTEQALQRIAKDAADRWQLSDLTIIHRYGRLRPGGRIVFVGAASRHRKDAIEAMHFVIDWLKMDAPFWKREEYDDGRSGWVEERREDLDQRDHWRVR